MVSEQQDAGGNEPGRTGTPLAGRSAVSAGGVVFRRRGGRIEVVLVARTAAGLWALPKGTRESGETLEQTALREVEEETGLRVQIVGVLGSTRYSFTVPGERVRVDKVVHHYLMEAQGGDVSLHDEEHDVVDWVDVREARRLLTYAAQRDIVDRASVLIANRAEDESADGSRT